MFSSNHINKGCYDFFFFYQQVKKCLRTCGGIQKTATGQEDD